MSRIYVASSWRNERQPEIVKALRGGGHEVYDFRDPGYDDPGGCPPTHGAAKGFAWSDIDPGWQGWSARAYRDLLKSHPVAAAGFLNDLRAMKWADTCVLVLPCGRSAHLELGWMAGAGKRTVILLADGEPELMNLLADDLVCDLAELLRTLSPEAKPQAAGEIWRHLKTGGLYVVIAEGRIEADLSDVVIYRSCKDGSVWTRPKEEFHDGRFVRVDAT